MDKILSQDEINALFSTMSADGAALENSATGQGSADLQVARYDFCRSDRIAKEQIRAIHSLHTHFARSYSSSLSAYLRALVEVNLIAVDQIPYTKFLKQLSDPTLFCALSVSPLRGNFAMELSPAMVFPVLDILLGGAGKSTAENRTLTDIEMQVIEGVVKLALRDLKESWRPVLEMHPKLEALQPYTALQLAGKDIYQREGCNNCHTQTVRPLRTEVLRYGEYSKAGEFAYDRPFLWGSKRTGPDLARIGGKYPDVWHYRHHEDPQSMFPKSNMPKYAFLKEVKVDASATEKRMLANGFPYIPADIEALGDKTEMDALVAYLQVVGTSVKKKKEARAVSESGKAQYEKNPLAGDLQAIASGKKLYEDNCMMCHGEGGKGDMGPSLVDDVFLYVKGDLADDDYFEIINNGTEEGMVEEGRRAKGGMPPYKGSLDQNQIWSLVAYIRSLQGE